MRDKNFEDAVNKIADSFPHDLTKGAPLVIEDISATLKVTTYQGPVRYKFFKRVWLDLTCKHDMAQDSWFHFTYCCKCGRMK